jgi:hypothetical protein
MTRPIGGADLELASGQEAVQLRDRGGTESAGDTEVQKSVWLPNVSRDGNGLISRAWAPPGARAGPRILLRRLMEGVTLDYAAHRRSRLDWGPAIFIPFCMAVCGYCMTIASVFAYHGLLLVELSEKESRYLYVVLVLSAVLMHITASAMSLLLARRSAGGRKLAALAALLLNLPTAVLLVCGLLSYLAYES